MALRHRNKRRMYSDTFSMLDRALNDDPKPWPRVAKMALINSCMKNKIRSRADSKQVNRVVGTLHEVFSLRVQSEQLRKDSASKRRKQRQKRKGVSK